MNTLRIAILLALTLPAQTPAAEKDTKPLTLDEAKTLGRANSNFLKATREDTSAESIPKANLSHFQDTIRQVLNQKCVACHGPEDTNANLRVDQLNPDLLTGPDVNRWRGVYKVLSNSEMPPQDEADFQLADADRRNIVEWLGGEIEKASRVRRNRSVRSSFRRLTKYEYEYALQDLLGLAHPLAKTLPPETASEDGFKNNSALLQMSAMQFKIYREIGLKALKRATVRGARPKAVTYIISMQDEFDRVVGGNKSKTFDKTDKRNRNRQHLFNRTTGRGVHFSNGAAAPKPDAVAGKTPPLSPVVLVLARSNELKLNLDRFLPDDGIMRVRIRAGRSNMQPNEYAGLRLIFSAHTSNNANFSQVISQRDISVTASADDPAFIHFDISLSDIQRNPFRKLETKFPRRDEFLHIRNISNASNGADSLQVFIDYIEISAPHYDQWPPKTHTDIFFESKNRHDEQLYGREVLTRFMERVWRRPVTSQEVNQFMGLFDKYRSELPTFEDAMVEVLATALATPEFLYLTQKAGGENDINRRRKISDVEFASRLSFFLWSSIPDKELLELAKEGKLRDETVLKSQVERMLADSRARRFSKNFVEQWLGMDGLSNVTHVSDSALKEAMREEPVAFFEEVLKRNRNVIDFIHSDYVVVNERLAKHLGIPGVYGPHFRPVTAPTQANRGGILTAAAMLTMNSDGKDSHPLKRGLWLLERILHDPPPPPPPDVPEVDLTDPKILQMTLKERIADHRNKPACYSCHAKIDPWGIAFENYDAMGAYRTSIKKKPVDATSTLFNKQELEGINGLKRYLLTDRQDQFARAMVHKMTAYALGRSLTFGDSSDIDRLTVQFRKQGDRLGDLVHLIVGSDIFNSK